MVSTELVTLFPTIFDEVFTCGMGKGFTRKGERAVTSAPPECSQFEGLLAATRQNVFDINVAAPGKYRHIGTLGIRLEPDTRNNLQGCTGDKVSHTVYRPMHIFI